MSKVSLLSARDALLVRTGTGPPLVRTHVIYVDLGYSTISDPVHPKGDPAS